MGGEAPAQRGHDVDHVVRRRRGLRHLPRRPDVLPFFIDDLGQPLLNRIANRFVAPRLFALLDQLSDEFE